MENKGLTLIEIIVVMAIIAIASTIVWMSVNALSGFEAKQCAKYIFGALEKTKVEQMTRQGYSWLHLYRGDDGVYLDIYESGVKLENEFKKGNRVGNRRVLITYTITDAAAGETPLDEDGIVLAFNRSDGSFKAAGQAWALSDPAFTPKYPWGYYLTITIKSGNTSRTIALYPNTGKLEYAL